MSKNTIKINGNELKRRIECDLNMSIYEIATDNGYSRNLIAQAIRTGKASPVVQTLLRLYGIMPEEYELKEIKDPEPPKKGQMTFEDIEEIKREELKALMQDVLFEIFYNSEIVIQNDKVKGDRLFLRKRGGRE